MLEVALVFLKICRPLSKKCLSVDSEMAVDYVSADCLDILLVLGECIGNSEAECGKISQ
jgi:hypothetical protein